MKLKTQYTRQELQPVALHFVLAGTIAAITQTVLAPYRQAKFLLRTQDSNVLATKYKGTGDCLSRLSTEKGKASWWRGNFLNSLHYASREGSALALNDFFNQSVFPRYHSITDFKRSLGTKMLCGGLAGAVSHTLVYPLDYARTRIATFSVSEKTQFRGLADCLKTSVRNQGIMSLYTGWMSTCLSAFVFRAGQLGVFGQIQEVNPYRNDKGINGVASSFVAVTAGRAVVLPLTYPLDVVRRRILTQAERPLSERAYRGSLDCFRRMVHSEGVFGMYHGVGPELFRGVGGSLVIVLYDRAKLIYQL